MCEAISSMAVGNVNKKHDLTRCLEPAAVTLGLKNLFICDCKSIFCFYCVALDLGKLVEAMQTVVNHSPKPEREQGRCQPDGLCLFN